MAEAPPTTSRSDRATIIVDTREQEAYSFPAARVETVRRALSAGDYSLDGYETSVAIERKTLEDYVNSVIHARERFMREVETLATYDLACVAVEATFDDVASHRYRSRALPYAVVGATMAIIVSHGVPVFFCGGRQLARRFVEDLLCRYHRKVQREVQRS